MTRKMISPDGVKANMVCASCLYCKYRPTSIGYKNVCIKTNKLLDVTSGWCDNYKMSIFFVTTGYKEIKEDDKTNCLPQL